MTASSLVISELASRDPRQIVGLTVDQYHEMIRQGIVAEGARIELLDGVLVRINRSKRGEDIMSVGEEHRWAVEQLRDLNPELCPLGCCIQSQQPITIVPANEPEPDAAILVGTNEDYRRRKPVAADVLCVIEVADSSLEHDRTTKLHIYAQSGIPQYVIVNLAERQVELYSQPSHERYTQLKTVAAEGDVVIALGEKKSLTFRGSRVLP